MSDPFEGLPRNHFGAILADPPWHFEAWASPTSLETRAANGYSGTGQGVPSYNTLKEPEISAFPVAELAADDCVLFLWVCWPVLEQALRTLKAWSFKYKTCGFCWIKGHAQQLELFQDHHETYMGLGYWTRANSEVCLLATRGQPKRLNPDVRQAIIAPRREHSRKPDGIHERIERLVAGPYLELFARQRRPNWTCWGNETEKFDPVRDIRESVAVGFEAIRERKANGGPGWEPNE